MKKSFAIVLALCLAIAMITVTAFADAGTANITTVDTNNTSDVVVQAKINNEASTNTAVYKVDLGWGNMQFEYATQGTWNAETHTYDGQGGAWNTVTYVNGTNNKITVTNHSNKGINTSFAFAKTSVSAAILGDAVGGHFYALNETAVANTNVETAAVVGNITGTTALPTADAYNDGTAHEAGARSTDFFFTLNGTPDTTTFTTETFAQVGTITVTIAAVN